MANKPTLLVVNVHFAPNSFGGATVVAEHMAAELSNSHGWRLIVVTTHQNRHATPFTFLRYKIQSIEVFSIVVPDEGALSYEDRYLNEDVAAATERIVNRLHIDVAHVHCIQTMGIGIIRMLKDREIPVVTTVHDCWWLCERMFMIDVTGRYCYQQQINMNVCRNCVVDYQKARQRFRRLSDTLNTSDLILFPSEFHRNLYLANGFQESKCLINKNGVQLPGVNYFDIEGENKLFDDGAKVRFGFVGGPGDIKGAPLIRKAFSELPFSNYQLKIVDGAQNRGLTWAKSFNWNIPGELVIVPPYNRDNMDDFFRSIDVLLFPSQWKESFGLTVREAIVRGVWVIATDAGGVVEDCIEGENSNIIPLDGGHSALKSCIESILKVGVPPRVKINKIVSTEGQAAELDQILRILLER